MDVKCSDQIDAKGVLRGRSFSPLLQLQSVLLFSPFGFGFYAGLGVR